jgi:diguanylate cyclase (GGDEF)-like protein/PAS domain S-box-containing protein
MTIPLGLVVDNDEQVRRLFTDVIRQDGMRAVSAPSGSEGLDMALALHPDFVVTGIEMPGLDGVELCRRLRQSLTADTMKIIAVGGSAAARAAALAAGCDVVLRKPCPADVLLAAIGRLFANRDAARVNGDVIRGAIFNSPFFSSIGIDAQGVIQAFSSGSERMLGHTAAEVVNKLRPSAISDPQAVIARAAALRLEPGAPIEAELEVMVSKASRQPEDVYEWTYLRKDGSHVPVVVLATALRDAHHAIIGYLLIATDNSARKQIEAEREALDAALFAERERARVTLESIGDAVISTDAAGAVEYLNAVASRLTGWSIAEAIGRPLTTVFNTVDATTRIGGDDPGAMAMRLRKTVDLEMNRELVRRDGSELPIEASAAPVSDRNDGIAGAVIVFRDATTARALSRRLTDFSRHDVLTNLPNRALLDDRIGQARAMANRRGTRLAILFIDLDRFKHVNDSLGHAIGDGVLKSVALRLVDALRDTDTASRWGGDEFVVLLTQLDEAATAAVVAAKIIAAVSAPIEIADHVLHISASIGISIWPEDATTVDRLIAAADAAMYKAKELGGHTYQFFTSQLNDRALARRSLEASLEKALQRRELMLYYQPKNNLQTSRMVGIEAFVRWRHPRRGLLTPDQFMKIAEDSGLILPIGRWVLVEACRQTRAWQTQGLAPTSISVNVSAVEFRSKGFLDGVANALRETELAPQYLELEFGEGALTEDVQYSGAVLQTLKDMGVRVAIHNFATGRSSLSFLSRIPIGTLKIDRSFVRGITTQRDCAAIVNAVVGLGRNLNQRVLAEGVETDQQVLRLQELQCVEGQGYFFSHPLDASQFTALLREEKQGPQSASAAMV